ncbi:MAG: MoaD/ThiS family protein [Gammaproteobacteria bacterium]
MTVKVKFFASMRDEFGRAEDVLDYTPDMTLSQVWQAMAAGRAMPENVLAAVNKEHVKGDPQIADGDEVAFFPPVTGG